MIKVLVSACLLGERVRYHGGDAPCPSDILDRWKLEGRLVSACPEVAGGLPVPRPPAEIAGGDGHAVLKGDAVVGDGSGAAPPAPSPPTARPFPPAPPPRGAPDPRALKGQPGGAG